MRELKKLARLIYEVSDKSGVYCIEGTGAARVFYVAPEFTLIDTGMPGKANQVLSGLAQIGVQPLMVRRIILTHHHWDHVGGLWEVRKATGAQILAHPSDADYISGKRMRRPPRHPVARLMTEAMALLGRRQLPFVDVDRLLKDREQVGSFTVIHTPGHTPGHICLLRGDILFSGDLLTASAGGFSETPHVFTADVRTSRASIRKVATFDFEAILASHNRPYVYGAAHRVRELANRLGMMAD